MWTRLDLVPPTDVYGLWLRAVMIINGIALAFDVADVIRYVRGERQELVQGL